MKLEKVDKNWKSIYNQNGRILWYSNLGAITIAILEIYRMTMKKKKNVIKKN